VLNKDSATSSRSIALDHYDPEQFVGSTQVKTFNLQILTFTFFLNVILQIPILVIGTKLDLVEKLRAVSKRNSAIAEECGADEIHLVR
jgi:small basic protein